MRRGRGRGDWGPWDDWRTWSGFAGGPRGRFFEFGEVRLAILSLLEDGDKHGYQLIKEMEERSGGLYRASAGTVYPTLQQLEDEGMIASDQREGRRVYRLTDAGKDELKREEEAVGRIWERADRWGDWGRWVGPESFAVLRPLGRMVKMIFRAAKHASGDPEKEERVIEIIERACRELEELSGRRRD
jgi:DNA-binding PadR family transcriptional regulator